MHILTALLEMIIFERFLQVAFLFYSAQDPCTKSEIRNQSAEYNTNLIYIYKNIYEYEYNMNFIRSRKKMWKIYYFFSILTKLCLVVKPVATVAWRGLPIHGKKSLECLAG